jgi:hypothetical protein
MQKAEKNRIEAAMAVLNADTAIDGPGATLMKKVDEAKQLRRGMLSIRERDIRSAKREGKTSVYQTLDKFENRFGIASGMFDVRDFEFQNFLLELAELNGWIREQGPRNAQTFEARRQALTVAIFLAEELMRECTEQNVGSGNQFETIKIGFPWCLICGSPEKQCSGSGLTSCTAGNRSVENATWQMLKYCTFMLEVVPFSDDLRDRASTLQHQLDVNDLISKHERRGRFFESDAELTKRGGKPVRDVIASKPLLALYLGR